MLFSFRQTICSGTLHIYYFPNHLDYDSGKPYFNLFPLLRPCLKNIWILIK